MGGDHVRLSGRRVVITGASRGIGAALARGFRDVGADLALVARSSDELTAIAEEVGGSAYPCDLSDLDAIVPLVERIETDGPVDVLINNAGTSHVGWFLDRTIEEIDQVVTVNLLAPLHLCRLLLPGMIERGRGHVINVSSMAAVMAPPGLAAYGVSKAGLSQLNAQLRADLRDQPIRFTTVHLGSVSTDMDREARSYGPLRELAESSQGRDISAMEDVVAAVVGAVRTGRQEVRLPWMLAPLAVTANLPRRVSALLFRRAPVREERPDR